VRLLARLGAAAGVALVVLVGVLLALLPSQGEERAHSVLSNAPSGLRALYLAAEGLGFPVRPWRAAPGELAGAGALLVWSARPAPPPPLPAALAQPEGEASALRRSRELGHYRRFVEEGGTLLVLGAGAGELAFLRDTLGLEGLDGLAREGAQEDAEDRTEEPEAGEPEGEQAPESDTHEAPAEPSADTDASAPPAEHDETREQETRVRFRGGEEVTLACGVTRFRGVLEEETFVHDSYGEVVGFVRASGAGRVALLGVRPAAFENGALQAHRDALLVFVRALEALAPAERVLFDEYALGGWKPEPVSRLAFSPRLALLSLHLVLLVLVLGWRSAWTGPFARDPEAWLVASPLARARGFGRLLARANRWELLARLLRHGVLARLEARTGRFSAPSEGSAPSAGAGVEAELAARIERLARGDERRRARLTDLFVTRAPRDEAELSALERELATLEAELTVAAEPRNPARAGGARVSTNGS